MINPVFPAFRPLLASTRGDWGAVGRQIENLTREHLIGIRDFVRMLANTLVLPYALRVHEDREQADVQQMLQSAAHRQMALMLAARWHIGTFLRRSAEWHEGWVLSRPSAGTTWATIMTGLPGSSGSKPQMGLWSRPLCSSGALREEGVLMHHCAGGYTRECMTGRTQIFSLRTASGKRLSTLQVVAREIRPGTFQYMQSGRTVPLTTGRHPTRP